MTIDAPRRDDHPHAALGEDPGRVGPMPCVTPVMRAVSERGEVRARGRLQYGWEEGILLEMQDSQYEMLENLPRLRGVLSVEEHVLGCMCDSFRS